MKNKPKQANKLIYILIKGRMKKKHNTLDTILSELNFFISLHELQNYVSWSGDSGSNNSSSSTDKRKKKNNPPKKERKTLAQVMLLLILLFSSAWQWLAQLYHMLLLFQQMETKRYILQHPCDKMEVYGDNSYGISLCGKMCCVLLKMILRRILRVKRTVVTTK